MLLVRPDYTIYDEVRKTRDFQVFADMRLAGVGMIGVVHANKAIDALQRLLGRVEMGMIPQVVDTVVFIEKGEVTKILDVEFVSPRSWMWSLWSRFLRAWWKQTWPGR